MEETEFLEKLKKRIVLFTGMDFEPDHKLNGYLDNLSIIELIMKIEEHFNIFIADDLASPLLEETATFNDLYSVVDAGKLKTESMFNQKRK